MVAICAGEPRLTVPPILQTPLSEVIPPYVYAFSLPSGHALNITVIAGMVAYLLIRPEDTVGRFWTARSESIPVGTPADTVRVT